MKKTGLFIPVCLVAMFSIFLSCTQDSVETDDMENMLSALREEGIDFSVFSNAQSNRLLVVPRFGGRILSAFVGGENLFWTHPDILEGQGGQRSWVSPEGGPKGFLFKPDWSGSRDFSMMDPGQYSVVAHDENRQLILENSFRAISNDQEEEYDLTMTREIRLLDDPFADEEKKGLSYQYLGIDFVHKLRNNSSAPLDRLLALWCLIQVPPKGTMVVPVKKVADGAWRGNYFEPIPPEFVVSNSDSFSFFVHGSRRYKVGLNSRSVEGIICYIREGAGQDHSLIIMKFPYRDDAVYPDKPKTEQETNGDAIQIYSHLEEGKLAFGELECHSWGLDLPPGGEEAFPIKIMLYKARLEVLREIGQKLVCPGFGTARLF